ncbi:MAG TPA: GNAT family N-acetyltransferase [Bacillota bacterium]|nr:GNAT family N-acetyltransferase [Bacillota bacterium]
MAARRPPELQLTPLQPGDDEFRQTMWRYWRELGVDPNPLWAARYIARIDSEQGSDRFTFWCSTGAERCGFAMVRMQPDWLLPERTIGYIAEFYVFAAFRRKGVGRVMAERMIQFARDRGAEDVELDVLPTNRRGMQFWQALGFALSHHHMRLAR